MRKIWKKILPCVLLITLLLNFNSSIVLYASSSSSTSSLTQAGEESIFSLVAGAAFTVADGIVGVLTVLLRVIVLMIAGAVQGVITAIASFGGDTNIIGLLTPDDVLFNRVGFTSIDFFDFTSGGSAMIEIKENIAAWYYTIRIMAMAALLVILIYVGIRMAISTVASDQAKYKQMLTDWVISFALVFMLHYIIILVITVNNGLVGLLNDISNNMSSNTSTNFDKLASGLVAKSITGSATMGWAATICYCLLIGVTAAFLFSYIKRMLIVGFLILISPIITIFYAIDKLGDGKAQTLNTWLREFMMNVLIQPFHCLIYLVFASVVVNLIEDQYSSISAMILAVMCMRFIWEAEKIVKQIFGFKGSATMADTVASLAAVQTMANMASKASKELGGNGKVSRNLSNVVNSNKTLSNIGKTVSESKVGQAVSNASSGVNDLIEKGKNSSNILAKVAANSASVATKVADPKIAGAIVLTGVSEGANQKTSFNTGLTFYNTAKDVQNNLSRAAAYDENVQNMENDFLTELQRYQQQDKYSDASGSPINYDQLKTEIEGLMSTNLQAMDNRVQMLLNRYVSQVGYTLSDSDDVTKLATDMDMFSRMSLKDIQDLADRSFAGDDAKRNATMALATAMQQQSLAIKAQQLKGTYQGKGVTDTKTAIDEVLDRVNNGVNTDTKLSDDEFNTGPNFTPQPTPTIGATITFGPTASTPTASTPTP